MWKEWLPTTPILKDCSHIWLLPVGKLFSFNTSTQFAKIPFYTLTNSKIVIFTKVENGGIVAKIVNSSGLIETQEYAEGEGVNITLQIEIEVTNTNNELRYLEIEGIPNGGFTCSIYDLTVLLAKSGGGWKEVLI